MRIPEGWTLHEMTDELDLRENVYREKTIRVPAICGVVLVAVALVTAALLVR